MSAGAALAALREHVRTLPADELRTGYRNAVMRFALAGSLEGARTAHDEATVWAEAYQAKTGAEAR